MALINDLQVFFFSSLAFILVLELVLVTSALGMTLHFDLTEPRGMFVDNANPGPLFGLVRLYAAF